MWVLVQARKVQHLVQNRVANHCDHPLPQHGGQDKLLSDLFHLHPKVGKTSLQGKEPDLQQLALFTSIPARKRFVLMREARHHQKLKVSRYRQGPR